MQEAAEDKEDKETNSESEHDRLLRESPEVRNFVKESMENHWRSWPDMPLPALRGMTPRQAAKDTLGRELLESLLIDFELQSRNQQDDFLQFDVARLRRELALEAE